MAIVSMDNLSTPEPSRIHLQIEFKYGWGYSTSVISSHQYQEMLMFCSLPRVYLGSPE
jgi:hypothetical protein